MYTVLANPTGMLCVWVRFVPNLRILFCSYPRFQRNSFAASPYPKEALKIYRGWPDLTHSRAYGVLMAS